MQDPSTEFMTPDQKRRRMERLLTLMMLSTLEGPAFGSRVQAEGPRPRASRAVRKRRKAERKNRKRGRR